MQIIEKLSEIWKGVEYPFLIHKGNNIHFSEITNQNQIDFNDIFAIFG